MRKLVLRVALICAGALICAPALANEAAGNAPSAKCARLCDASCLDLARGKAQAQDATSLALLWKIAETACKQLREERAYSAFEECRASKGACERVACEAPGTSAERAQYVISARESDKASCRASQTPQHANTPIASEDDRATKLAEGLPVPATVQGPDETSKSASPPPRAAEPRPALVAAREKPEPVTDAPGRSKQVAMGKAPAPVTAPLPKLSAPADVPADVPAEDTSGGSMIDAGAPEPLPGAPAAKTEQAVADPNEKGARQPCGRKDALGVARTIAVSAPEGGLRIGLESYPQTLDLKAKEVVLTFDDGPNPGTTERILDALRAECVEATFFLIGRNAIAHPTLVKRELREGHSIGAHSWSHPARTLAGISETDAIGEITRGFAAVDQALGDGPEKGGAPKTPWFRFPGFADTEHTLEWLDKRRIVVFGTDLWAADWVTMSPEAELTLTMKHLAEHGDRGIVLFHDTRTQTAAMLPKFLQTLKEQGYRVVHVVYDPSAPATKVTEKQPGWKSETAEIVAKVMPRLLRLPPYREGEALPAKAKDKDKAAD